MIADRKSDSITGHVTNAEIQADNARFRTDWKLLFRHFPEVIGWAALTVAIFHRFLLVDPFIDAGVPRVVQHQVESSMARVSVWLTVGGVFLIAVNMIWTHHRKEKAACKQLKKTGA